MAKKRNKYISKPVYPGGLAAMRKFVTSHLRYPAAAKANQVTGTVIVRYSVDYRGQVVAAKIKKSLGYGCDEEALRVVKMLRFNMPRSHKKKYRIHQDLNVHFQTNTPPAKTTAVSPTTPEPEPAPTPTAPPLTIRYTITGEDDPQKAAGTKNISGYVIRYPTPPKDQ